MHTSHGFDEQNMHTTKLELLHHILVICPRLVLVVEDLVEDEVDDDGTKSTQEKKKITDSRHN